MTRLLTAAHVIQIFPIPEDFVLPIGEIAIEPVDITCPGRLDRIKIAHTLADIPQESFLVSTELENIIKE